MRQLKKLFLNFRCDCFSIQRNIPFRSEFSKLQASLSCDFYKYDFTNDSKNSALYSFKTNLTILSPYDIATGVLA